MSTITYDEVNLMLRLYDMRREARLRQARTGFSIISIPCRRTR